MKTRKKSGWKRWVGGGALLLVLLAGGYYVGRHQAWPAFKAWRVARMNRSAREFLDAGDPANALLTARKSLQSTTQNPGAWRLAVAASVARERSEAVSYQNGLVHEEPTTENRIELVRLALKFEVPAYALEALKAVGEDARDNAEFHRLAAQTYARVGQIGAARAHLQQLVTLQPGDGLAQLDLAEIDLKSDRARANPAVRVQVLNLADQPALRVRALGLLLQDHVAGGVTEGTLDLVRRLQLLSEPGVPLRLLIIQGLELLKDPSAAGLLAAVQGEVGDSPAAVAQISEFLTATGRAARVAPWIATLPDATRQHEDVQHMHAVALLALQDAAGLEALLRGGNWPKREFLREAILAHAYRDLGRPADFAEAWRLALIGAGSDLRHATALLACVTEWRWTAERPDVVWKLFALVPTNVSLQQALAVWERQQGNTVNLNRLFTRIVEVQPGDNDARNNLAYTNLLLDANGARAGLMAAELAAANPQNPYYATTHALALYKQGKVGEALARLNALSVTERLEPVRMLLRGLCLAGLGQPAEAADLLLSLDVRPLLPEEQKLAAEAKAELARLDRLQGNRSRLAALPAAEGAGGWLAQVAPATRTAATTEMRLADTLYAAADWEGLLKLLQSSDWRSDDYLRSALHALVLRRRSELPESQQAWRQALALANRDPVRLRNLQVLATAWEWAPERLESMNLVFERTPDDPVLLAELRRTYRAAGRTADLNRVLGLHVAGEATPGETTAAQAYYSLLLDTNLARAHVAARAAYDAAPADPTRRMIYAFSLWKQRRTAEAGQLVAALPPGAASALLPVSLIRALILQEQGKRDEARTSLATFQPESALPEEIALAERIASQLAAL